MAEETGKISATGLGFFKADGSLKSKEELEAKPKQESPKQAEESVETSFSDDITNVLSKVENRFIEKANSALETVARQQDNLKDARKVVNEQLSAARDLKEALKEGNEEKATELREKLQELSEKREALSKQIDQDNRESAPERRVQLRLGKEEVARVEIKPVKFDNDKEFDSKELQDVKDVNKLIDSLREDKASIRNQVSDLREAKQEIKNAIKTAKTEIREVRKNSITTFEDAEKVTSRVSKEIESGGIAVLEKTISSRLSPDLVSKFLQ